MFIVVYCLTPRREACPTAAWHTIGKKLPSPLQTPGLTKRGSTKPEALLATLRFDGLHTCVQFSQSATKKCCNHLAGQVLDAPSRDESITALGTDPRPRRKRLEAGGHKRYASKANKKCPQYTRMTICRENMDAMTITPQAPNSRRHSIHTVFSKTWFLIPNMNGATAEVMTPREARQGVLRIPQDVSSRRPSPSAERVPLHAK